MHLGMNSSNYNASLSLPNSDDEEEMLISEEEVPFKDDPRDETYKPHLDRCSVFCFLLR